MYSAEDLHKGGVSPFGHPRINDRSHLPAAFRSVPRPSSPLGAKASTERPYFTLTFHRPHAGPTRRNQSPSAPSPHVQSDSRHREHSLNTQVTTKPHNNAPSSIIGRRQPTRATQHTIPSSPVKEHEKPPRPGLPSRKALFPEDDAADTGSSTAARPDPPQLEPIFLAWRRSDSNRRPPACKAGALPLSYAPTSQPTIRGNPTVS
jgi:hypothetical protein